MPTIDYTPDGQQLRAFLRSDDFARFLVGPFGSGKTSGCCVEVFRRAVQQKPGKDKVRRSRWMVVRSTYPQLRRTTIASWLQWFDHRFGAFTWGPPARHRMVLPLSDGTVVDLDVQFTALDGPTAEADLKGAELTGLWFNEFREIPKGVLNFALGRVGRYPAAKDGGPSWTGIIGDSNAFDSDSFWYRLGEEETPEGWSFFKQPGGVLRVGNAWVPNGEAENLKHLPGGAEYYTRQMGGQSDDWIKVFLGNEYGLALDGRPIFPEYVDSVHCVREPLEAVIGVPLIIGMDFGLTPAVEIGQQLAGGRWQIIDELVAEDMGVERFAERLRGHLARHYPNHRGESDVEVYGDPAGNARAQTDERTCIQIVREVARLRCQAAPSNDLTFRLEAVRGCLNRMVDGKPGFQISPKCKVLRRGLAGGYSYRRLQVGEERYSDRPDKNAASHPADALQYLLTGDGEGPVGTQQKIDMAKINPLGGRHNRGPTAWMGH